MKPIYRPVIIFLIPLLLIHFWIYSIGPTPAFVDEKITTFEPVTAEPKPVERSQAPKKGISKWWYALILAAAAGGGGGGGNSGSGGSSGGTSTVTL